MVSEVHPLAGLTGSYGAVKRFIDAAVSARSDCDIELSSSATPLSSLRDEAERILAAAEAKGVTLRLLGGMAVNLRCPSASRPPLSRRCVDVDVVGHRKETAKVNRLFVELGYKPRERFNALNGSRLIFNDLQNQRRIDVFLDVFEMSHKFNFKDRLALEEKTIPLSDLLSTKLQIVQINEKDVKDICALLLDHEVAPGQAADKVDAGYLAKLCANDWGIYKTFTINLSKLQQHLETMGLDEAQRKTVAERAEALRSAIEAAPKSTGWKMRAAVGERKRWYELPEADQEVVG